MEKNMFDTFSEQRRSARQAKEIKVKIARDKWDKVAILAKYAGCPVKYVPTSIVNFAIEQALKDYDRLSKTEDFRNWKIQKGID